LKIIILDAIFITVRTLLPMQVILKEKTLLSEQGQNS